MTYAFSELWLVSRGSHDSHNRNLCKHGEDIMSDRVTLVTGASSGIGRELALLAAEDSRAVVVVARRRERLEEVAAEIEGAGSEGIVHTADLTEIDQRRGILEEMERRELPVDHLINNAGLGLGGRFDENSPDAERSMVELNVGGLHDLCTRFLPGMVRRGYGRVLNVASTAAWQPLPYMATYAATKAFVLSLSGALWKEFRGTGVTVTCLAPGRTETEFFDDPNLPDIWFSRAPTSSPEDVARAGYRGMLAGRRVVVPGWHNKLMAFLSPRMPGRLVLAVAAALFRPRGE